MSTAAGELGRLVPPWRAAFEEAWESWRTGNFGIGAVLVDPRSDAIVSTGRNRVAQPTGEPRTLSGNFTAHAEMNAFAAMTTFSAAGLHLYTTLEPCLMCMSTSILLNVEHIHFAARDEFFEGLDDLWTHHPYTRQRRPASTGPLAGPLARIARALPFSFAALWTPDSAPVQLARVQRPELLAIAERLPGDPELGACARNGSFAEALDVLWSRLA
jgi:tRNA(Arg) A34 adenosine deaminase TadA